MDKEAIASDNGVKQTRYLSLCLWVSAKMCSECIIWPRPMCPAAYDRKDSEAYARYAKDCEGKDD